MTALVSVLTPTVTGREKFFSRCRASVAGQTYQTHRLYHERCVEHVVVTEEGIGPMAAFQKCLDRALGEYVMPLSDDDWLAPHAVETLVAYLDDHDVVFARMLIVSPGNDRLVDMGCAVMWRKAITDEVGGYDLRWKHAGDSELYGRFVSHGYKIAYCPEPLYFFTEHAEHHSYLHRDELAVELREIHALHPSAVGKLAELVA